MDPQLRKYYLEVLEYLALYDLSPIRVCEGPPVILYFQYAELEISEPGHILARYRYDTAEVYGEYTLFLDHFARRHKRGSTN